MHDSPPSEASSPPPPSPPTSADLSPPPSPPPAPDCEDDGAYVMSFMGTDYRCEDVLGLLAQARVSSCSEAHASAAANGIGNIFTQEMQDELLENCPATCDVCEGSPLSASPPPWSPSPPWEMLLDCSIAMDISYFTDADNEAKFKLDYCKEVAQDAGVSIDQVTVLSIKSGSVVVESRVEFASEEDATTFESTVNEDNPNVFSDTFTTTYGDVTIDKVSVAEVETSSPPPSTSSSQSEEDQEDDDEEGVKVMHVVMGVLGAVGLSAGLAYFILPRFKSWRQPDQAEGSDNAGRPASQSNASSGFEMNRPSTIMAQWGRVVHDEEDNAANDQEAGTFGMKSENRKQSTVNPLFDRPADV
ncbi:hypothetical protein CYMTET_20870 [Cymbomonas tetramitiformis]|uniref:Uncharacterized protein n=1 Tax=Cymbomonas tetramitiformis TaxID=36881 RepID=A0AAE0G383_9CHLO|nr:hypothetical protein CYMTET_20870 [Cymbomonas tetramitiformis]